jgi:hypothetical protein
VKIAGFLLLQTSLLVLIAVSLWAVFSGSGDAYTGDEGELDDFDGPGDP